MRALLNDRIGLNEFMNRELWRLFPKGTAFSVVTQAEVASATKAEGSHSFSSSLAVGRYLWLS